MFLRTWTGMPSAVKRLRWRPALLLFFIVFTLGMGSHQGAGQGPLSIAALFTYCGLPAACTKPVVWEGESVRVQGRLDPIQIFDRQRFPHLPYEKFLLSDNQGHSLEIWTRAKDNQPIFAKLAQRPSKWIVVTGRLEAVQLPVNRTCKLGIKVVIENADQIEFKRD